MGVAFLSHINSSVITCAVLCAMCVYAYARTHVCVRERERTNGVISEVTVFLKKVNSGSYFHFINPESVTSVINLLKLRFSLVLYSTSLSHRET